MSRRNRGFASPGRRLDGAPATAARGHSPSSNLAIWAGAPLAAAACCFCPSGDSFEAHLTSAAAHPAGLLGLLGSVAERLQISVLAESTSYLFFRVGRYKGRSFLGAFGTWVWLPLPVSLLPDGMTSWLSARSYCERDLAPPHELFASLCVIAFLLCAFAPRFCYRHASCSVASLKQGRVWTLLTSNIAHAHAAHLLHNLLNLLNLAPVVHATLGCEQSLAMLLAASLASSIASVLWHGVLRRRPEPKAGSIGSSGVVMAYVCANAALFPRTAVRMYGVEVPPLGVPLLYLFLDAFPAQGTHSEVDVSAHLGGAAAGWLMATRFKYKV